jgi:cytochrome c-type biogenesis protein CcmH/NrfG
MLGPKTLDWKTGLAQALFAQQKATEAIALLDELLKQQPEKECVPIEHRSIIDVFFQNKRK